MFYLKLLRETYLPFLPSGLLMLPIRNKYSTLDDGEVCENGYLHLLKSTDSVFLIFPDYIQFQFDIFL